ncbi:MAG TPA: hypothetical protein VG406_00340 [Isosphaeraceae bacterium]|jgi:hypothetical protein|nr:hypothetical protein [Isosphaeraceae bacterium]
MNAPIRPQTSDPDETRDIHDLIDEVIPLPGLWLDTPNENLGGARPRELIGTDREEIVRDLARAIKNGMFS